MGKCMYGPTGGRACREIAPETILLAQSFTGSGFIICLVIVISLIAAQFAFRKQTFSNLILRSFTIGLLICAVAFNIWFELQSDRWRGLPEIDRPRLLWDWRELDD